MPKREVLKTAETVAFGARVLELRKQKMSMSQEGLADVAGLHRTYVGAIERGERNVSLMNLYKLARALGVEVRDLF